MFSPDGPSLRELCVQASTSVERGYDLLATKFDHTPFRTPQSVLDATVRVLADTGPFSTGLDVCCGTGAGLGVLDRLCRRSTGVDFSAGMLAQARHAAPDATLVRADALALPFAAGFDLAVSFGALGHFLPSQRPALFEGVYRALRPGGVFAVPIGEPAPLTSGAHWRSLGFDLAMLARNTVLLPQFVMYYRTTTVPAVRRDLWAANFTVESIDLSTAGEPVHLLLAHKSTDAPVAGSRA
ncbi:class I SAM-dependent methyltransferase [Micromonosporaceae bacterium Da 78-11]